MLFFLKTNILTFILRYWREPRKITYQAVNIRFWAVRYYRLENCIIFCIVLSCVFRDILCHQLPAKILLLILAALISLILRSFKIFKCSHLLEILLPSYQISKYLTLIKITIEIKHTSSKLLLSFYKLSIYYQRVLQTSSLAVINLTKHLKRKIFFLKDLNR